MPREWVQERHLFWNEQYLVLAFLMFNNTYEPILGNHFLARDHVEAYRRAFPLIATPGGASFWMRKR
jgi:hypothetical protein